jgi:regulatory protein
MTTKGHGAKTAHQKPAISMALELMARRDHSRTELWQKLSARYSESETSQAIESLETRHLLPSDSAIRERLIEILNRKLKSSLAINQALEARGLSPMTLDPAAELEKALQLIEGKLAKNSSFDYEDQYKLSRFLAARGFDEETIHSVIHRPWKERS